MSMLVSDLVLSVLSFLTRGGDLVMENKGDPQSILLFGNGCNSESFINSYSRQRLTEKR